MLAAGIVFLAIGLILVEVPFVSQPNCGGNLVSGSGGSAPASLTCKVSATLVPLNIVIYWSTDGPGIFNVSLCTSVANETLPGGYTETYLTGCSAHSPAPITSPSGGSGSVALVVSTGDYIEMSFTTSGSYNASTTAKSNLPLVGYPIAIFGAVVIVIGLIMKKKEETAVDKPREGESQKTEKDGGSKDKEAPDSTPKDAPPKEDAS
jgi:hypothetical protein